MSVLCSFLRSKLATNFISTVSAVFDFGSLNLLSVLKKFTFRCGVTNSVGVLETVVNGGLYSFDCSV